MVEIQLKISIITVVLNNKSYIEDCINSVLSQSYSDVEYIVVDGGARRMEQLRLSESTKNIY